MRISMFVLALNLTVFGAGCQYTPQDGITDPNDDGNDTSDNNVDDSDPDDTSTNNGPPAGSTTASLGFTPDSDVRGVKIYCELESELRRGAILFVDGTEDLNVLQSNPLGTQSVRNFTVANSDAVWCQGFVTTQSNPPLWNKLLVDDRANRNNPDTWGDFRFDGWTCGLERLVHNEPASADNSWDTQWGAICRHPQNR